MSFFTTLSWLLCIASFILLLLALISTDKAKVGSYMLKAVLGFAASAGMLMINIFLSAAYLTNTLGVKDSIPDTVLEDESEPFGNISGVESMSTKLKVDPSLRAHLTLPASDTSIICLRPKDLDKLTSAFKTKAGVEGGTINKVVWGDKGVWATTMNYSPNPKFNLYKPFKYDVSKFYLWGINYTGNKSQMRIAGTTLECALNAGDAGEFSDSSSATNSANLEEASSAIYKYGRVGYVKKTGSIHIRKVVNSSYNREVIYRVGTYVASMIGNFEKFNVKPHTLHFANVLSVNQESILMRDFGKAPLLAGSESMHRSTFIPVIASTLGKLKGMPSEVETDFESLDIDPDKLVKKVVKEVSAMPTAGASETEMALKLKKLEEEIALLKQDKNQNASQTKVAVPEMPKVKVPVISPPAAAHGVDETTLAKNISGN